MTTIVLPDLSRDKVSQAEIQNALTAIQNSLNAVKLRENNLEPDSIHLRHLNQLPKINLSCEFGTAKGSTIDGTPHTDGSKNWYHIPDSILKFNLGAAGLPNMYEANKPVIQLFGPFHTNHCQTLTSGTSAITEVCIGMSTNGGTTWTPLEVTKRPTGQTCGREIAFFKGPQKHYLFNTSNYHPHYDWDRGIWLIGSFGGDKKVAASDGSRWFSVMVDQPTTNDGQFYGQLFGDMRRIS